MTDDELIAGLKRTSIQPMTACSFILENACPSGWNVTILVAGANFYYSDGTSDTDGPRQVLLTSGQKATFYSKNANGCVKRIFFAFTASIPNEGTRDYAEYIDDVPPDMCMHLRSVRLGPKNNVSEEAIRQGRQVEFDLTYF